MTGCHTGGFMWVWRLPGEVGSGQRSWSASQLGDAVLPEVRSPASTPGKDAYLTHALRSFWLERKIKEPDWEHISSSILFHFLI